MPSHFQQGPPRFQRRAPTPTLSFMLQVLFSISPQALPGDYIDLIRVIVILFGEHTHRQTQIVIRNIFLPHTQSIFEISRNPLAFTAVSDPLQQLRTDMQANPRTGLLNFIRLCQQPNNRRPAQRQGDAHKRQRDAQRGPRH